MIYFRYFIWEVPWFCFYFKPEVLWFYIFFYSHWQSTISFYIISVGPSILALALIVIQKHKAYFIYKTNDYSWIRMEWINWRVKYSPNCKSTMEPIKNKGKFVLVVFDRFASMFCFWFVYIKWLYTLNRFSVFIYILYIGSCKIFDFLHPCWKINNLDPTKIKEGGENPIYVYFNFRFFKGLYKFTPHTPRAHPRCYQIKIFCSSKFASL